MIADDNNFIIDQKGNLFSTSIEFEQEYNRLLNGISFGELLAIQQIEEGYRNISNDMEFVGIDSMAMRNAYGSFENAVGGKSRANEILTMTDVSSLTEEEREARDRYIQKVQEAMDKAEEK